MVRTNAGRPPGMEKWKAELQTTLPLASSLINCNPDSESSAGTLSHSRRRQPRAWTRARARRLTRTNDALAIGWRAAALLAPSRSAARGRGRTPGVRLGRPRRRGVRDQRLRVRVGQRGSQYDSDARGDLFAQDVQMATLDPDHVEPLRDVCSPAVRFVRLVSDALARRQSRISLE